MCSHENLTAPQAQRGGSGLLSQRVQELEEGGCPSRLAGLHKTPPNKNKQPMLLNEDFSPFRSGTVHSGRQGEPTGT